MFLYNVKTISGICILLIAIELGDAQQPEPEIVPAKVTLCDLAERPEQYATKMVEVHAILHGVRYITLSDVASPQNLCSAYMGIGLELPSDIKPKPSFDLANDESFQKVEKGLKKGMGVIARVEGRFDPVFTWKKQKRLRVGEGNGFGPKNLNEGRIVLHKVMDVVVIPIPRPR